MLWPAPGSAISVGTSPEFASSMPPSSAITGTPVRPWNSRPTLVSARTGVVEATEIVALTRRGLSGASPSSVTSPTRMPLNSTRGADQEPGHRAVELDVIGRARDRARRYCEASRRSRTRRRWRPARKRRQRRRERGFPSSLARFGLQHLGALAVEIGPHPGMLGLKQFAHRSDGDDLAVRERRDAIADGVQAGEVVGDHEHRQPERLLQCLDQGVEIAGRDRDRAPRSARRETRSRDRARARAPAPRAWSCRPTVRTGNLSPSSGISPTISSLAVAISSISASRQHQILAQAETGCSAAR